MYIFISRNTLAYRLLQRLSQQAWDCIVQDKEKRPCPSLSLFILQQSSKPAVGSGMALIHMGSPLCSVEHTMAAVQRLIQLHRGLNIVKF